MPRAPAPLLLAAAGALLLAAPGSAQDPQSIPRGSGAWVSRFIPKELFLRMQERPETIETAVVVTAPAESVWTALRASLEELAVPIGFEDRAAGEIGHAQARLYRRMGKQPLSSYLRCGSGLTGPNADRYQVFFSIVTFVQPMEGGRIGVAPYLTAHAVDPAASRSDGVLCTTTGRLEGALARALRERLGEAAKP